MKLRTIPLVIAFSVIGCSALGLWYGSGEFFLATAHQNYTRDSWKWWFATPFEDLREAPLVHPLNVPQYQYHPFDFDFSPDTYIVRYRTAEPDSVVWREMDAFLRARGWEVDPNTKPMVARSTYIRRNYLDRYYVEALTTFSGTEVELVYSRR